MLYWNEKQRNRETYYSVKARELEKKLLEKYPHLAEDMEFLQDYCMKKVRPADTNPDVEKLIKEEDEEEW